MLSMRKTALALRHVHFEDLGSFGDALSAWGYEIRYSDVGEEPFCQGDPCASDLLIVLGGPVGVYEDAYPFLDTEWKFIRTRLEAGLPTLGICLGAQLIASALGERVYSTGLKEIGFSPLTVTEEGHESPLVHFDGVQVLHWHGDTYTLPIGAQNLASTSVVEQQAFSIGPNVLGIQFHPEVETDGRFERWLIGHSAELAGCGIDTEGLRTDARMHGQRLKMAAHMMLQDWLTGIELQQ
ncbi:glutamine amidotransferase [Rhizobium sp. S163]|nr:glutamine amidotransferase [Rhizobium sp. S163]MDM9648700.1 glutamine amidotransferase [Rhizobium sp. S163]